eukprot:g19679.t1
MAMSAVAFTNVAVTPTAQAPKEWRGRRERALAARTTQPGQGDEARQGPTLMKLSSGLALGALACRRSMRTSRKAQAIDEKRFPVLSRSEAPLGVFPKMPKTVHPGVVTGQALKDLLNHAKENGYAIPAVNCVSSSSINACIEAARKMDAPIMIQFSAGGAQFYAGKGLDNTQFHAAIAGAVSGAYHVRAVAEQYGVPVILHTERGEGRWGRWGAEALATGREELGRAHFFSKDFLLQHIADIIAFYKVRALDPSGGFFQSFRIDGTKFNEDFRQIVSSARMVINFMLAGKLLKDPELLKIGKHGLEYLEKVHYVPEKQSYAFTVEKHKPKDMVEQAYGYAFVLAAHAAARTAGVTDSNAEEPLEENIEICVKYLERMAKFNCGLEMELGITGGEEDGVDNGFFTVAAAFGNVHGVYQPGNVRLEPKILDRAQKYIAEKEGSKPVSFVFHGGSGSDLKDIREAVGYGVIKMNIDTDTQWSYWSGIKDFEATGSRDGQRMGDWKMTDTMIVDGLWCAFNNYHMGMTAENVAAKFGLDRAQQDAFAAESQRKAAEAQKAGRFKDQIVPMQTAKKGKVLDQDEYIKADTSLAQLQKLKPAFKKEPNSQGRGPGPASGVVPLLCPSNRQEGTVTAGNASGLNDGAALCLLMSAAKAQQLGLVPLVHVRGFASAGVDPKIMGTGPIPSSKKVLEKAGGGDVTWVETCGLRKVGWSVKDLDIVEANEAFAAQALAVNQEMGWDAAKVNVNGGAIAIGHPIGASGCRIAVDLIHEMKRRNLRKGLATLCIGGGQGVAMCFERLPNSKL